MFIAQDCYPSGPGSSLLPGKKKEPLTQSLHLMTINDNKYSFLIHLYYILQKFINMCDSDQVIVKHK